MIWDELRDEYLKHVSFTILFSVLFPLHFRAVRQVLLEAIEALLHYLCRSDYICLDLESRDAMGRRQAQHRCQLNVFSPFFCDLDNKETPSCLVESGCKIPMKMYAMRRTASIATLQYREMKNTKTDVTILESLFLRLGSSLWAVVSNRFFLLINFS